MTHTKHIQQTRHTNTRTQTQAHPNRKREEIKHQAPGERESKFDGRVGDVLQTVTPNTLPPLALLRVPYLTLTALGLRLVQEQHPRGLKRVSVEDTAGWDIVLRQ